MIADSGCGSAGQLGGRLLPSEVEQLKTCLEARAREEEASGAVLSCWRRYDPDDWALHRKLFEETLAARIAPEDPQSIAAREFAACAVPRLFALVEAASCKPSRPRRERFGDFSA